MWLAAPAVAAAQTGPDGEVDNSRIGGPDRSASELAVDLVGDDRVKRRAAARELRRQARVAARRADGPGDRALEARIALDDLRADVLDEALRAVVESPDIRAACADLLAVLGGAEAEAPLRRALEAERRKAVRERLEAALVAVGGAP